MVFLAPISFELTQVRVADALIPLSILFGWPAVVGVSAGCTISNVLSPMPSVIADITFGSLANFVASFLAWKIAVSRRNAAGRELLGCIVATIIVTLVVGTYLAVLTRMEVWLWWIGVGIGSAISICGIGFPLVQALKRAGIA